MGKGEEGCVEAAQGTETAFDEPAFSFIQNSLFGILEKWGSRQSCPLQDDPLCIGEASVVDLFTALGQWLTTKNTEVIGPKPVEFLGTRVWRTLGAGWRADRGSNITSPGVDIKGTNEEESDESGHSKFRRGVGKVQFFPLRRRGALFATKRCWMNLASPTNTDEQKLERLVKELYTTSVVKFQAGPRPKEPAHFGRLDGHRLGRMQGDTAEHCLWSHRVVRRCVVAVR